MICQLNGCPKEFAPKHPHQRFCCKTHAQRARSARFRRLHPSPKVPRPTKPQHLKDKTVILRAIRHALLHGTHPSQIQIWVDEFLINAIDYEKEQS